MSSHEKRKLAGCTSEKCQQKPSGGQKVEEHFPTNTNETKKKKKKNPSILKGHWALSDH